MSTVIQNTDEWLQWRHTGIGASDSNIIMGVSPYKTILELWEEKINPLPLEREKPNFIQQKGHDLEEVLRKKLEAEKFMDFPPVTMEMESNPRIRASLDGYNKEENINWECKLVGKDIYAEFAEYGTIPEKYYPQLMHQCLVSGAKKFILTCGLNADTYMHREYDINEYDLNYIENDLLPNILRFINAVDNKISPSLSENDTVHVDENVMLWDAIKNYRDLKERYENLKGEYEKARDFLFEISGDIHNRVEINGVKITRTKSEDKTVGDPVKYCKEMNIDLTGLGYTKVQKGRETRKVTFPNE